jgi:hypothetical protein
VFFLHRLGIVASCMIAWLVVLKQVTQQLVDTVATLALGLRPRLRGLQGCGPRGSPGVKAKGSPGVKARGSPRVKARGSPGVASHTPRSVRKCEGMNPHTLKATPT